MTESMQDMQAKLKSMRSGQDAAEESVVFRLALNILASGIIKASDTDNKNRLAAISSDTQEHAADEQATAQAFFNSLLSGSSAYQSLNAVLADIDMDEEDKKMPERFGDFYNDGDAQQKISAFVEKFKFGDFYNDEDAQHRLAKVDGFHSPRDESSATVFGGHMGEAIEAITLLRDKSSFGGPVKGWKYSSKLAALLNAIRYKRYSEVIDAGFALIDGLQILDKTECLSAARYMIVKVILADEDLTKGEEEFLEQFDAKLSAEGYDFHLEGADANASDAD